jgi:uncharacterized membrane protein YkvA (DUF1232 family)
LVRFALDPRVAPAAKLLAVFALIYVIFPVDLLWDVVPILGWIDDVGLSALAFILLARAYKHYRGEAARATSPAAAAPGPEVVETTGHDVPRD